MKCSDFLPCIFPCYLWFLHTSVPSVTASTTRSVTSRLPLTFEANRGQVGNDVKFLARGSGYGVFLADNEIRLGLISSKRGVSEDWDQRAVVSLKFKGANPMARLHGLDEQSGKVNYLVGNDPARWHARVPTFARVKLEQVYPGVDVICYGNPRQPEYDIVVAPGADLSQIALEIAGAEDVKLTADGDLLVQTAAGDIRQH